MRLFPGRIGPTINPLVPIARLGCSRDRADGRIRHGLVKKPTMLDRLMHRIVDGDSGTVVGRAIVEERFSSLRRQVPVIYLLGFVNLSGLELASTGKLSVGINLPTFILFCGIWRLYQWANIGRQVSHAMMIRRMRQTTLFAALVCGAVCLRCIQLLVGGDPSIRMAVMLFGGLTAIGVAYGLTALPAAGLIPLVLIVVPISVCAIFLNDIHFAWAAFALVTVAALTMRLLLFHSRHLTDLIRSRSMIAREQQLVERAHREAVVAATTDFLTGLPNRRAFIAALEAEFGTDRDTRSFAVAILDLDRFKVVNDTFGHAAGDQLLGEVAARLVATVGSNGLVARLGGDEFGVLLPGIRRVSDAQEAGGSILRDVNRPLMIAGTQLAVSACCGLAIARSRSAHSPSRLMADADLALYQAKQSPSGSAAVFELRMEAPRRRRIQIERALLAPGIEQALSVSFQPIVDLKSGRILAHEALARWTDRELGPVSPAEFIPIAEQLNLIDMITHALMGNAFREACSWAEPIRLSFNLSAVQLHSNGSARLILKALKSAGLSPERLQVEVTETALLADFQRARANLTELRSAGVTIVLDDFGAGFASIGYLRELRFDQIKLDGALVTAALDSADGRRLLSAVIRLCEILGVASIAEHVESEDLLKLLKQLGCSAGQGFWLKPPLTAEQIAGLVTVGAADGSHNEPSSRRAA